MAEINSALFDDYGIIGGYDLGQEYDHLDNHMLLAVTEMATREDIDCLAEALGKIA